MGKPILPFVETMITQVCNLSCTGCTNYSDLQHEGYVPWSQGRDWIESWLERVDIADFGILGGEPTVSPEVNDWILGLRQVLPKAQIRFTTNGLLLNKKFDIVENMADVGNCVFKIAFHQDNPELEEVVKRIFDMYDWEPVVEYGVHRWKTKNNFRFHVKRPDTFWKTFKGPYEDMAPHTSIPSDAFDICCQQTCPLLHNGRIYKCSTSGLLAETLEKFNTPNSEQWQQYLQQGMGADCSDQELTTWLENFGKPANVCGMCPSPTDLDSKIIHLENVSTRKIKWK
jgi:sulfatase maturation enzyme AslB (radical SAM superfamily)|tara:strand:- start:233 stop:1087 length:855 start_codon:yes stop_codon:yes gene_type:complete